MRGFWVGLLLLPVLAMAAPARDNDGAGEVMYRYTTPDGNLALSATLTQQAIHSGFLTYASSPKLTDA